jgi:hypothetical protein
VKTNVTRGHLYVLLDDYKSDENYNVSIGKLAHCIYKRYSTLDKYHRFYANYLQVNYYFRIKVMVTKINTYWTKQEPKTTDIDSIDIHADLLISELYELDEKELKHIMMKQILDHIYNVSDLEYYCYTDEVATISIECSGHIGEMMAFGCDESAIYHIEQECGEDWIVVPHKPNKTQIRTIINRN